MKSHYHQATEAGIRFFSILIVIALTHLLEAQPGEVDALLLVNRWPCFIVGVAIFLRYIVGSSNHLWFEHEDQGSSTEKDRIFVRDLGFLMLYGVMGVCAFFSSTLLGLFSWLIALAAICVVWAAVLIPRTSPWRFWIGINLAQGLTLLAGLILQGRYPETSFGRVATLPRWLEGSALPDTNVWLTGVALAIVVILFVDLRLQLKAMPTRRRP